ncbi:general odorant-binding protein 57c-like [Planococcus citri]|uniref:general odorant-binding protein 57c-like n=1 Tax=Planococcus citri TaxID=170843 RepID=UPI0031F816CD
MRGLIFITFVVFIKIVYGIEKEQAVTDCISELSIAEEVKSHFRNNGEIPDETDSKAKCLFHCVSKKIELTNEQGDIDKDKVVEYVSSKYADLDKTKLEAVVLLCAERSETDPCEKWYEFTKCQLKAFLEYKKGTNN